MTAGLYRSLQNFKVNCTKYGVLLVLPSKKLVAAKPTDLATGSEGFASITIEEAGGCQPREVLLGDQE